MSPPLHIEQLVGRAVQVNADGEATVCGDRRRTWRDVHGRMAQLSGALAALGVVHGARVALLAVNSDLNLECAFGVARLGAIVVPLNTRLTVAELTDQVDDAGATILVVSREFLETGRNIRAAVAGLLLLGLDGGDGDDVASLPDLAAAATPALAACTAEDIAAILYTGGTTGRPKGVMISHRAFVMGSHQAVAILGPLTAVRYLYIAPMFHIGAWCYLIGITLHAGCHIFPPPFTPEGFMSVAAQEQVTHLAMVPTMISAVVNHPDFAPQALASLRRIIYGAAPITGALLASAISALPWVTFAQSYGQTETSTITILAAEDHILGDPRLATAGRAALGVDVQVQDAAGRESQRGELGEVCCRSGAAMTGYWNRPDATAQAFRDGWLRTGDVGRMDEAGYLTIVDRLKDMIISGGENIYSAEVEDAVSRHPAVLECAIIGLPHPRWGEQVHAIVRLREGRVLSEAELIADVRTRLAAYKCPKSVTFSRQPFPLSGAGKVLKRELRDLYAKLGLGERT